MVIDTQRNYKLVLVDVRWCRLQIVALSTKEVEYVAAFIGSTEGLWISKLLNDKDVENIRPLTFMKIIQTEHRMSIKEFKKCN